jgi:hypothetical protein
MASITLELSGINDLYVGRVATEDFLSWVTMVTKVTELTMATGAKNRSIFR